MCTLPQWILQRRRGVSERFALFERVTTLLWCIRRFPWMPTPERRPHEALQLPLRLTMMARFDAEPCRVILCIALLVAVKMCDFLGTAQLMFRRDRSAPQKGRTCTLHEVASSASRPPTMGRTDGTPLYWSLVELTCVRRLRQALPSLLSCALTLVMCLCSLCPRWCDEWPKTPLQAVVRPCLHLELKLQGLDLKRTWKMPWLCLERPCTIAASALHCRMRVAHLWCRWLAERPSLHLMGALKNIEKLTQQSMVMFVYMKKRTAVCTTPRPWCPCP